MLTLTLTDFNLDDNHFQLDENDNFNPNGLKGVVILDANGEQRMLNVERDIWHSLQYLESGSVLFESKDGKYEPLRRMICL